MEDKYMKIFYNALKNGFFDRNISFFLLFLRLI